MRTRSRRDTACGGDGCSTTAAVAHSRLCAAASRNVSQAAVRAREHPRRPSSCISTCGASLARTVSLSKARAAVLYWLLMEASVVSADTNDGFATTTTRLTSTAAMAARVLGVGSSLIHDQTPVPLSSLPLATVITESMAVLMVQKITASGSVVHGSSSPSTSSIGFGAGAFPPPGSDDISSPRWLRAQTL